MDGVVLFIYYSPLNMNYIINYYLNSGDGKNKIYLRPVKLHQRVWVVLNKHSLSVNFLQNFIISVFHNWMGVLKNVRFQKINAYFGKENTILKIKNNVWKYIT